MRLGRPTALCALCLLWVSRTYGLAIDDAPPLRPVPAAIADAVASVNRPLLSQYHQLRTKGDKGALVQLASN